MMWLFSLMDTFNITSVTDILPHWWLVTTDGGLMYKKMNATLGRVIFSKSGILKTCSSQLLDLFI